jgi:hypothetical protein
MYKEYKPSKALEPLIHAYWVMLPESVESKEKLMVFPDGCFDIVIDFNMNKSNHILLSGIWDQPIDVTLIPGQKTLGIRFYPTAINQFFLCDIADYKNTVTEFEINMVKPVATLSLDFLYSAH